MEKRIKYINISEESTQLDKVYEKVDKQERIKKNSSEVR